MSARARQPLDASGTQLADLQMRGLLDPFTVVAADTEFADLVRAVEPYPHVRTVAVTDADGKLSGIIPMRAFYAAIFADVYPEALMGEVASIGGVLEAADQIVHPTAGEVMLAAASVAVTDSLHDAFIALYRSGQAGLPVVDAENRPVGYLDLLAILPLWEQRSQAG